MSTEARKIIPHPILTDAFKQNEVLFRALIENSSDAIALLTDEGIFLYVSPSVQKFLGFTPAELLGRNAFELVPPDHSADIIQQFQNLIQSPGSTLVIEHQYFHKDGSIRWIESSVTNLLSDTHVHAIISNFRDITERRQAEERQRLLNETSNILVSSLDHQITLKEIAVLIVPSLADYCRIALVDAQQQIQEISVNHIDPEKINLVKALYDQYKDQTSSTHGLQKLLETGTPELISNVSDSVLAPLRDNPQMIRIVHALDLHSYMGVPLIARDKIIGAITFSSIQPQRHYSQEDLLFTQELARRIALTLDNTRLYQEAQEEIAERKQIETNLLFLSEASKILSSSLNYQTTLANIAQLAVPHIADWCSIDMSTEEGIQQLVVAHVDPEKVQWAKELNQKNTPDPNAPTGLPNVLRTGQSEFYPNISEELLIASARNEEELSLLRYIGFTSIMIVPLLLHGKAIGAVTFVTAESGRNYTAADLSMAEELASRAALAIENAHLYSEAQNAIGIRDDFISIASHELKTPVTSLKMFTQILQKQLAGKGEENLSRSLTRMDAQLNKLTLLIGDLLNVSKLELGQLALQEESFDLNGVVQEMVEQVQLTTIKHAIRLEGTITHPVWGDKDRIGQVLMNLLNNAVKYSPQADTIIVRLTSEQNMANVSIQDFGIGIDEKHQNKIFTRFYRVSDPEERTYPGLGIGLYLSHEIMKRHGGNLAVTSEKGKGSVFCCSIPFSQKNQQIS